MPKRPLVLLGGSAFAAAMAAARLGPAAARQLSVLLGAFAFLAGLWSLVRRMVEKHRKAPFSLPPLVERLVRWVPAGAGVCAAAALVLGLFCWQWETQAAPVQFLDGREALVRMQLLDYPQERYHRFYYQAEVASIDGQPVQPFTIRLSCAEPIYGSPYDWAEAQVVFYCFPAGGQFSRQNAQLADGNVLGAYLADYDVACVPSAHTPLGALLAELRQNLGRGISRYLPKNEAGLVRSVLLGQRSQLSGRVYTDFTQTGCSHVLSISGLHMTALAGFLFLFIRRLPLGPWGRSLCCALPLFLYLFLTGCSPSAARSFTMFFFYLLAQALGRRQDSLSSLGAAVLVLCLLRPFSGGDLGFCLSVLSTAGIILLYRPLRNALVRPWRRRPRLRRALAPIASSLAVTGSVVAFTLPLQAENFGGISLLTPLANLLLVPLTTLLLYGAIPLAALAMFPGLAPLTRAAAFFVGWLARLEIGVAERLASLPGSYFSFGHGIWPGLLGAVLVICFWTGLRNRRTKGRKPASGRSRGSSWGTAALLAALLAGGACYEFFSWQGVISLAVCGDGDSACVLVMKDGHGAALSLGGFNSGMAERLLTERNIPGLDSVFLPVRDSNARAMAQDLLSSRRAERLLLPEEAYRGKDLEKLDVPIQRIAPGQAWQAVPGAIARLSEDGGQVLLQVYGKTLLVEAAKAPAGWADILVTGRKDSAVQAGLTVLAHSGQEPESVLLGEAASGQYLLADGQTVVWIHLWRDGSMKLERECF